jgi:hypothetical protein
MTETAPYDVTGRIEDVELRAYPVQLLATVAGTSDDEMFMALFRYIGGNNRGRTATAILTAPFTLQNHR